MIEELLRVMYSVPVENKVTVEIDQANPVRWTCTVDQLEKLLAVVKGAEEYIASCKKAAYSNRQVTDALCEFRDIVAAYKNSYKKSHVCEGSKKWARLVWVDAGDGYFIPVKKESGAESKNAPFCQWCGEKL